MPSDHFVVVLRIRLSISPVERASIFIYPAPTRRVDSIRSTLSRYFIASHLRNNFTRPRSICLFMRMNITLHYVYVTLTTVATVHVDVPITDRTEPGERVGVRGAVGPRVHGWDVGAGSSVAGRRNESEPERLWVWPRSRRGPSRSPSIYRLDLRLYHVTSNLHEPTAPRRTTPECSLMSHVRHHVRLCDSRHHSLTLTPSRPAGAPAPPRPHRAYVNCMSCVCETLKGATTRRFTFAIH